MNLRETYPLVWPLPLGLFWFSKSLVTAASKIRDLTRSSLPKVTEL